MEVPNQRADTPSMNGAGPDEVDMDAAPGIPTDEATCANVLDGTVSDAVTNLARCTSPTANGSSSEETEDLSVGYEAKVDPSKIITNEMLALENKLHTEGSEAEEKRKEDNAKLLSEMTEDTDAKRYERLQYLLTKSNMYTEYLVGRMKVQKEEEAKRRERILKKKHKKKEEAKKQMEEPADAKETEPKTEPLVISTRSGKRKVEAVQLPSTPQNKRPRRHSKGTPKTDVQESDKEGDAEESNNSEEKPEAKLPHLEDENPVKKTEAPPVKEEVIPEAKEEGEPEVEVSEEPDLQEKASTFGIALEDEGTESRTINGEAVPFLQPLMMTGGVLRNYQIEGYSWLKVLFENGVNGILADEMGLGKTVQCVAIISHLVYMGIPGPFFVCGPLSTIPNWFAEFQRFAPKVPVILYHGHKDRRMHLLKRIRRQYPIREGISVQPVVITSYEMAMIDRSKLANFEWKYLIVDEGHRIKNTHCRLIRDLRMYKSTNRLLLTGTPLQNNLAELWSLLNFLLPEIFDDLGSFEAWFDAKCMGNEDSDAQIIRQEQGSNILSMFHQILAPFMLRRLKSDVDLCIPPKKEVLVYAPLTKEQKGYYEALVSRTIFNFIDDKNEKTEEKVEYTPTGRAKRRTSKTVDYSFLMESEEDLKRNQKDDDGIKPKKWSARQQSAVENEECDLDNWVTGVIKNADKEIVEAKQKTSQVTVKMRNVMMQLRKCCNHPYLLEHPLDPATGELTLDDQVIKMSGKMLVLDKMLAELKKRGHKVLIFSQMTKMLDLLEDFCQLREYNFCRLDGSDGIDDRRESMNVFNAADSDRFVFLLSTRAGGLGINLVAADTVIIYDSDWNPQCDLQAQDRCHRIGQTRPVVVYRFVTANTIDQKIIDRAANKRKLEKMVIHKGKFKSGNFMTKSKPISPEELMTLLKSKDYEKEVNPSTFSISPALLESLLDRSDLYKKWGKAMGTQEEPDEQVATASNSKAKKSKRKSQKDINLFKVLDTDEGSDVTNNNQESQQSQESQESQEPQESLD